jgi:hypothetical protein
MYSQFEDAILAALYQEQMHFDQSDFISFKAIVEKYGLEAKSGWLLNAQKSLMDRGLIAGPRNSSNDEMAIGKINGAGLRQIEEEYATHDGVGMIIEPASDIDRVLAKIVPAADRIVTLGHNQVKLSDAIAAISNAEDAITSSNTLTVDEKSDNLLQISLGKQLLAKGKSVAIGAVRYLILDRLKNAFESLIEDAFKTVLVIAFLAVAALLTSLII